jgi:hypothetical protein
VDGPVPLGSPVIVMVGDNDCREGIASIVSRGLFRVRRTLALHRVRALLTARRRGWR